MPPTSANWQATAAATGASAAPRAPTRNTRWLALACIALAQLMLALDATIVNIALPSAQSSLQFSDAQRQWVITAYTLAFGGLLLAGGRFVDALGRKRALLVGLAGFALASALSGAATNLGMLVAARALQGAFGALLAPSALSLLAVTFTEPRDRARAFAVYGAIAGSGGAAGLVLGGLLSQYLDWRWCLYVNVPVALVVAMGAARLLPDARAANRPSIDLWSALLATAGLVALVDATSEAAMHGWQSPLVISMLLAAVALLGLFVVRQARARAPLLPLAIVLDRNRGGAYLSALVAILGMFGAFLFLTYELQVVLGYPPLEAGLAFLPLSAAGMFGSGAIASRLLPRVPPRVLMVSGFLTAAIGMTVLTQLQVSSDYFTLVLPAEVLLGLGIGCVMVPAASTATSGVEPRDAGIASATLNTAQQIGASLGTALLNTLAASSSAAYFAAVPSATRAEGLVHGYSAAAAGGAAFLVLGAIVSGWLIDAPAPEHMPKSPQAHARPSD